MAALGETTRWKIEACRHDAKSDACKQALKQVHNPFFLESTPGNSQSQGWLNAWVYQNSIYAVEAATTEDIVAAVNFAHTYHIRLVVKGTGHDYLGRSNAANSLLIWTHNMRDVSMMPNFVPKGCSSKEKGDEAIKVSAGNRWIDVYTEVTTRNGRYVHGGGCTTVGAAGGFIQGGGFGSFSRRYGTGAGGILEAEVVTADGKVLTANRCQNQDLFWAIRGG